MTLSIEELRGVFESTRSSGAGSSLSRLSEQYDDFILELKAVPEDAWRLVATAFSDSALLKRRGIEHFLLEMNVDLPKYSAQQLREFLGILESNVRYMDHEIARHAAGDFIARAYLADVALKSFSKLSKGQPREKHVAFVGLDILRLGSDADFQPRVRAIFDALLASQEEWFGKT